MTTPSPLDAATRAYLARSYPKNHTYRVLGKTLVPTWRLLRRYRRIRALYPESLESLVDLSACKGWFCLHAAQRLSCARVLGIELHAEDLAASRAARAHLGLERVFLEDLRLHQLSVGIDDHGGPFDVALVVNLYHYLFFGSQRSGEHYGTHDAIFAMLRRVTGRVLAFSNCTEIEQLPRHMQAMAFEQGRAGDFTTATIRAAAARYFDVEERGTLGKRPLWRLTPKGDTPPHPHLDPESAR